MKVYNPPRNPRDRKGEPIGQASLEIDIPSTETVGENFVIDVGQLVLKIQSDIKEMK